MKRANSISRFNSRVKHQTIGKVFGWALLTKKFQAEMSEIASPKNYRRYTYAYAPGQMTFRPTFVLRDRTAISDSELK